MHPYTVTNVSKITLTCQVLAGNLPENWPENTVAEAFADFLKRRLTDVACERYPNAVVEVNVECQRDSSGYARCLRAEGYDEGGWPEVDLSEEFVEVANKAWVEFFEPDAVD